MRCRFVSSPFAAALLALVFALPAGAVAPLVSCPFNGDPGDVTEHGIVVPSYPGNNVYDVTLAYASVLGGTFHITLEIRRGSFDGPLVGVPQTAVVTLPADGSTDHFVTFEFGGAPVTPGDTLTMIHHVFGPNQLYFDAGGIGTCTAGHAYETQGTDAPLDTLRRTPMAIRVSANDIFTSCVPSDTTLCLDNVPGDRRFQATLSYATTQGGGLSGKGQALPLAQNGVRRGGLFWLFSQDNPEMLVKVLNGCPVNGKFWVFTSAGTNVGFTLNVRDTKTGILRSYTNADLHAAQPQQDISAFSCP